MSGPGPRGEKNEFRPPLKPMPGLFYLCMGLFVGWLGVLVYFYVVTVKPHPELDPHRRPAVVAPESDAAGRESVDKGAPAATRPGADGSPAAPR
jgi:hypothetical protein